MASCGGGGCCLKRLVMPHVVKRKRLAGHCLRSFAVRTNRHIADSPASVCNTVSGYAVLQLPDDAYKHHSGGHGERGVASQYGLFYHRVPLGPASLSIRHIRLPALVVAERNTDNQKFGHHNGLSVDGLLYPELAPRKSCDGFMRHNASS